MNDSIPRLVHFTNVRLHSLLSAVVITALLRRCMIAPTTTLQFSKVAVLGLPWVESPFLAARVFEHAPPALLLIR